MTETKTKVPAVYTGMLEVLRHLEVQNDGQLPGNMGGKGYRTAEAIANEVKRLLVVNDLFMIPEHTHVDKEVREQGNRLVIFTQVTVDYRIVSTKDGSSVHITGSGDGVAIGTAVSTNVGTTNALKNALRNTFMVSDSAAEEQGLQPIPEGQTRTESTIGKAKQAGSSAPAPKPTTTGKPLSKDIIRTEWIDAGKVSRDTVNEIMAKIKADSNLAGNDLMDAVLERLKTEVG